MAQNPFGELSYAKPIATYAGLPLDRIKETADILQDKYTTANDNANKIEIGLANMELHEKDEFLRTEATNKLNNLLNPVREVGNWEDAGYLVQKGAKDVASDRGLLAGLKSQQLKIAGETELQKRADEKKILQEDVDYEKMKAAEKYQGVKQNPITGAWEGFYSFDTPPDYVDIGKYTDDFLNNFKADEWFGDFQKGKDGKWYKAGIKSGDIVDKDRLSDDRQYAAQPFLEIASYDEVYLAARNQVLQQSNIKERLDYEIKKENPQYASKLAIDPDARKSMEHDLVSLLGYNANKVKVMSDDELTQTHRKEDIIHTSIEGSSLKHSYAKQKMQMWGQTWEFKMAELNARAAASGGGDQKTVEVEKLRMVMMTKGYKPNGMPYTIEEYNTQLIDMKKEEDVHNRTVETARRELEQAQKTGKGVEAAKINLERATTMAATAQANIADFEKQLALAIDKAERESGVDYTEVKQRMDKLNSTYTPEITRDMQEMLNHAIHILTYQGIANPEDYISRLGLTNVLGSINPNSFFSTGFTTEPADIEAQGALDRLIELNNKYESNPSLRNAKNAYMAEYQSIIPKKQQMDADVATAFVEQQKQKSYSYAYLEMGTTPNTTSANATKVSNYSNSASSVLKNNPGNFRVVTEDGKTKSWVDNPNFASTGTMDNGEYNINNITILGPTLDYINGVGYGYKATEQLYADDGKTPTGVRELIVQEKTGNALRVITENSLKKGELLEVKGIQGEAEIKGTGTKGYDEVDDYVYKMLHQEIDSQLSKFQHFPPVPPDPSTGKDYESRDVEIVIDASKRARVTRNTAANGKNTYDIEVWEVGGGSITPVKNKGYNDLFDVELVLETYAGYGADAGKYKIPISQLSEVANTDLLYGKPVSGMQSAPRLMEGFKQEWQSLERKMGKEVSAKLGTTLAYNITSMTRSEGLNLRYDGDPNSGHLYGGGLDISLNDRDGLEVLRWLNANSDGTKLSDNELNNPSKLSEYRTVVGTNIVWQAHSRAAGTGTSSYTGAGLHLDVKWADVKFQEEKKKLREYRANNE